MIRTAVIFAVCLAIELAPGPVAAQKEAGGLAGCAAIVATVSAARGSGEVAALPEIWDAARDPASGCEERALHCIGNALALGQLEATYAAVDRGAGTAELLTLAEAGLVFGAPWQLEAGLGDLHLDVGRAGGGGAAYSRSALHFQRALIGIGEPAVCTDFGEPPRPSAADTAALYERLSAALLLADPLEVTTTKCAPCQWLFLAGVNGFVPERRPLPITFASGSAEPAAAGREAIAALLECLRARGETRIVLSGHSDPTGSADANMRLSERRLERVAALLREGGFDGEIELEARGEEEPFRTEAGYFPEADALRLSRRIELRSHEGGEVQGCG